ncbi:type II toxin-antitoxin system Phd/YefM family antitoxin [Microcella sp.]|uniref:type II toxin-antitoxin system Phd/YefM family antitoxin n=1 Tax=Microcella sp. TaxID=1913979 RepID=UPI003F70E310
MGDQVNVHEAKTRLSELLARVERGDEIVIARGGRPIARLVAFEPSTVRELGFLPGLDTPESFFDPLPETELAAWEGGIGSDVEETSA